MTTANQIFLDECKKEHGSVVFGDIEYVATQQPYISDNGETYQSSALSLAMLNDAGAMPQDHNAGVDGVATIYWEITCFNSDDEANACDWDNALNVEL
jgi:hypothetical protein